MMKKLLNIVIFLLFLLLNIFVFFAIFKSYETSAFLKINECQENNFSQGILLGSKKFEIENVKCEHSSSNNTLKRAFFLSHVRTGHIKQSNYSQSKKMNSIRKKFVTTIVPKSKELKCPRNNHASSSGLHSPFTSRYKLQSNEIRQNNVYEEQAQIFRVGSMLKSTPKSTLERLELLGFSDPSFKKIKKADSKNFFFIIADIASGCLKKMFKPLTIMLVIMAICSIFKNLSSECSKNFSSDLTNIICIISMSLSLIFPFSETILYVSNIFKISCKLLLCYIPVVTGITISSGQCFTSFINSTFLIGFANFILQISSKSLVPILNALLAFACICAVTSYIDFSGIFISISKALKILLGILVTVFVGFFSMKISVNLAAEGAGTKALKFLLGSCVPVVGKALSDAASTIKGSLNLLKTSTCTFFIASMVMTFLPALVQCLLWYVTTLVCASVGESLQLGEISKFLKNLTEITGIIITLIICFLTVIIVSTLIIMRSAYNTS